MRVEATGAIMVALAASAALADIKRHELVPEMLRGSWAPSLERCTGNDRWVVAVSAKTYSTPDADCTVPWVSETAGAQGPIYSLRLLCSKLEGKVQRAQSDVIFKPGDANQVSIGPGFGSLKTFQRCTAESPAPAR